MKFDMESLWNNSETFYSFSSTSFKAGIAGTPNFKRGFPLTNLYMLQKEGSCNITDPFRIRKNQNESKAFHYENRILKIDFKNKNRSTIQNGGVGTVYNKRKPSFLDTNYRGMFSQIS